MLASHLCAHHYVFAVCAGDGGNDVSMIQAADAGVGIVGKVCLFVCLSLPLR